MTNIICRICLEESLIENVIYPCKCSGTSKYVHKTCLEEWRTVSSNRTALTECFECKYKYRDLHNREIVPESADLGMLSVLVKNTLIFSFISVLCIFILLGLIHMFDIEDKIDNFNITDIPNSTDLPDINYALIGTVMYSTIIYLNIIIETLYMKINKLVYIKNYYKEKLLLFGYVITFIFYIFYILKTIFFYNYIAILGDIMGIILIILHSKLLLMLHFKSIEEIGRQQRSIEIRNYEEEEM